MKLTKIQIIISLVILIIIIGGYWFFTRPNSNPTPNIQTSTTPTNSFFPLTAIKNVISTVTNTITSTTTNEISGEPFDSTTNKDNFEILRAHKLNATTTEMDLTSASSSVITSPDGKQIITLKNTEAGLVGELTNLKSKITTKVITSPLTDWLITWPTINTLGLQSKPASGVDGFAYIFDLKTKQTTKILGPLPGLNSLISPDGKKVIYSTNQNGQLKTFSKIIGKDDGGELGIKTLIDKCIWKDKQYVICAVPNNYLPANYPDVWYQGLNSFNDNIWLINTDRLETYLISISGKSLGVEPIDAINLKISPDGKTLYFLNKHDRSLWSFDLAHAF